MDALAMQRRWRACRAWALALATGLGAVLPARADLFIVVQDANPVRQLSKKEVVDLFMGGSRAFPDGSFALPFDLPRHSAERAAFYRVATGYSLSEVNSYWARLIFGGETMPPQPLPNEAAMENVVSHNASAIGYLSREPAAGKGLKVVMVLKTPAAAAAK